MSDIAQYQTAAASRRAVLREEILSNAAVLFPDVESPRISSFGSPEGVRALVVVKSSRFLPLSVMPDLVLCATELTEDDECFEKLASNMREMLRKKIEGDSKLAEEVEENFLEAFAKLTERVQNEEVVEGVKKALRKEALEPIERKHREREQEVTAEVAAIMARRKEDIPPIVIGNPEPIKVANDLLHEGCEWITEDIAPLHNPKHLEEERLLREQEKMEREEPQLYLSMKIITKKQFQAHVGFDLANWEDRDATEGSVPLEFRFKKAAKMGELMEYIAKQKGCSADQLRPWKMSTRQNKTIRPDQPLSDLDRTVEEMAMEHSTGGSDFRLWIEYTENSRVVSYSKEHGNNNPYIVVFLKYFDPLNQSLRGMNNAYMRMDDKVQEIVPLINEMMKWPVKTELKLFEEVKPTMIIPITAKQTFHQAEIKDGDIICFQKALTDKESEALKEQKLCKDSKEFYDMLANLISIRFLPKQDGRKDFILTLSKKNTYDEVAGKVAAHVGVPPTHLRFFTVNADTGQIRARVERTPSMTLLTMVTSQYFVSRTEVSHNQLYYEILEMPRTKPETRKNIKFIGLTEGITNEYPAESLFFEAILNELDKKFPSLLKKTDHERQELFLALNTRFKAMKERQEEKGHGEALFGGFEEKRKREVTDGAAAITARMEVELPPKSKPVREASHDLQLQAVYAALNPNSERLSSTTTERSPILEGVPEGGRLESEQTHRAERKKQHDLETQHKKASLEPHPKAAIPDPGSTEWEAGFEKRLYPLILAAMKDAGVSSNQHRLEDPFIAEFRQEMKALRSEIQSIRTDVFDRFDGCTPGTCTPSTSSGFLEVIL